MNFKNLDFLDISLTKLSVLSATLFLVNIWPQFAAWAQATHWGWFLAACLLLAIRPTMKVLKK